jgi:hypothetical protein
VKEQRMHVCVEKKKPRRFAMPPASPVDIEAHRRALEQERERRAIVKAMRARGDDVDPEISVEALRRLLTQAEWDALAIEGMRLP